jgi:hypothetical protein
VTLDVFAVGSQVEVGFGGHWVDALVTAVTVRTGGRVSYELSWWSGTNRTSAWAEECEVRPKSSTGLTTLGFANGNDRRVPPEGGSGTAPPTKGVRS